MMSSTTIRRNRKRPHIHNQGQAPSSKRTKTPKHGSSGAPPPIDTTRVKAEKEEYKNAPHTFVVQRGPVGKDLLQLILDIRKIFEPFTASKLKVHKKNVLKDFISVAGIFNVTHLLSVSRTLNSVNLKMAKLPRGPTISFKIEAFTLMRDVHSRLGAQSSPANQFLFQQHPLIVINGLSGVECERQHQLLASMLQTMFPAIRARKTVAADRVKRCVLASFHPASGLLEVRHYRIRTDAAQSSTIKSEGLASIDGAFRSKSSKSERAIPNLGSFRSIDEFVRSTVKVDIKEEVPSDSENHPLSDDECEKPDIKAHVKTEAIRQRRQAPVKLFELGPRLTLRMYKIEEEVCTGNVIYHRFEKSSHHDAKVELSSSDDDDGQFIGPCTDSSGAVKSKNRSKATTSRRSLMNDAAADVGDGECSTCPGGLKASKTGSRKKQRRDERRKTPTAVPSSSNPDTAAQNSASTKGPVLNLTDKKVDGGTAKRQRQANDSNKVIKKRLKAKARKEARRERLSRFDSENVPKLLGTVGIPTLEQLRTS